MSAASAPTWVIFRKECRESLRDRRVWVNALLVSPLLAPILFMLILRLSVVHQVEQSEQDLPLTIIGGDYAPNFVNALRQHGVRVLPPEPDIDAAVRHQTVNLALRIGADFPSSWKAGSPAHVEIVYDSSRREDAEEANRLRQIIGRISSEIGSMRLIARGISPAVINPIAIVDTDQATARSRGGLLFAMLPYFFVMNCLMGGMWLAVDAVAGERERQTLEALLINPVSATQLLLGKWLAAAVFSLGSLILSLLAFAAAVHLVPQDRLDIAFQIDLRFIVRTVALLLPVTLLFTLLQLLVASFARSYREAQTWVSLLQLIPLFPSLALIFSPAAPRSWMYGLPLVGQQLSLAQMLRGQFPSSHNVAMAAATTCLLVVALYLLVRRLFGSGKLALG